MTLTEEDPIPYPPCLPDSWSVSLVTFGCPLFKAAESLEHDVFCAEGFSPVSEVGRIDSYDPWRPMSTFHVIAHGESVKGVVRSIIGDYPDLPVGHFDTDVPHPTGPVCEYASLAIEPGARGCSGVAEALYRSVWQFAVRAEASGLVAITEQWLLDLLRDHYGIPFRQLGPSEWYMGGDCIPIGSSNRSIAQVLSRTRPSFWRFLCDDTSDAERERLSDLAT